MKISRKYETFSSESDDENYDESSSIDEETEKKKSFSPQSIIHLSQTVGASK